MNLHITLMAYKPNGRPRGFPKGTKKRFPDSRPRPLADRYWEKVEKRGPDECWPWLAGKDSIGYGVIVEGKKLRKAHRVGLELAGKEIPDGMVADHKCKHRWCQNPAHIEPETQRDNCTKFAKPTPFTLNMAKTHCKWGHAFTDENVALYTHPVKGWTTRVCLTCHPHYWRWAKIPRPRPPGTVVKRNDPDYRAA